MVRREAEAEEHEKDEVRPDAWSECPRLFRACLPMYALFTVNLPSPSDPHLIDCEAYAAPRPSPLPYEVRSPKPPNAKCQWLGALHIRGWEWSGAASSTWTR